MPLDDQAGRFLLLLCRCKFGWALEKAVSSLSRAKELLERIPDAVPCCHGLVAMAEASLLYKTGEHERTIELIERHRDAFSSPNAALNSQFPYFQAQALLAEAKALRDVGRYTDALVFFIMNGNCAL